MINYYKTGEQVRQELLEEERLMSKLIGITKINGDLGILGLTAFMFTIFLLIPWLLIQLLI